MFALGEGVISQSKKDFVLYIDSIFEFCLKNRFILNHSFVPVEWGIMIKYEFIFLNIIITSWVFIF